jgi:hypothetical protein
MLIVIDELRGILNEILDLLVGEAVFMPVLKDMEVNPLWYCI